MANVDKITKDDKYNVDDYSDLIAMTKRSVDFMSLDGLVVVAKCVDVYDGDTVTVAFKTKNLPYYKYRIRIFNLDTPEIRTKDLVEKKVAYEAREFVSKLILDKLVLIHLGKYGKYGRPLGRIYPLVDDKKSLKSLELKF